MAAALGRSSVADLFGELPYPGTAAPSPLVRAAAFDDIPLPWAETPDDALDMLLSPAEPPAPKAVSTSSTSFLVGLSLFGIAQMLNMERKTCVLEANQASSRGRLVFLNGELVDAEMGETNGDDAVTRMLAWPAPSMWILDGSAPTRMSVTKPITQLLLDTVRRLDEDEPNEDPVLLPMPTDLPESIDLQPDTGERLARIRALRGIAAAAIVDGLDQTVLVAAPSRPGFDLEATIAEIGASVALQLTCGSSAALGDQIEEIRLSGREIYHVIRPLDQHGRAYLYIALDRSLPNRERTIRKAIAHAGIAFLVS